MKIVYLAAGKAVIEKYNDIIDYNDLKYNRDLPGCMMAVDLSKYDILIASPPCNYYSRANRHYKTSEYSIVTRGLLPDIINKFYATGKPFIVENVINKVRMDFIKTLPSGVFYYEYGRHCYFTNKMFTPMGVEQVADNIVNKSRLQRQGGNNVNFVFEHFIDLVIGGSIK